MENSKGRQENTDKKKGEDGKEGGPSVPSQATKPVPKHESREMTEGEWNGW